jgi:hypothetical protein
MTNRLKLAAFALVLGAGASAAPVALAADDWEKLACRAVGFAVDRDSISVGRPEGRYKRIKLRVKGAPIEFYEVRVVFGNGNHFDIKIQQKVPANSESNAIDLPGDARGINQVDLIYRSIPTFKGNAEVCVIGKTD